MFEVRIVNGEGRSEDEKIFGPFATREEAAAESLRWKETGGCFVNEVRVVGGADDLMPPAETAETH